MFTNDKFHNELSKDYLPTHIGKKRCRIEFKRDFITSKNM